MNDAMRRLEGLVGEWDVTMTHAWFLESMDSEIKGTATFEWLADAFLVMRSRWEDDSRQEFVFGRNDARDEYVAFSHDDRGVYRVFGMTFADGEWTLLREDPDFHHRPARRRLRRRRPDLAQGPRLHLQASPGRAVAVDPIGLDADHASIPEELRRRWRSRWPHLAVVVDGLAVAGTHRRQHRSSHFAIDAAVSLVHIALRHPRPEWREQAVQVGHVAMTRGWSDLGGGEARVDVARRTSVVWDLTSSTGHRRPDDGRTGRRGTGKHAGPCG
jgi:hypothetical protein